MFIFFENLNIQLSYQKYLTYVLATDTPSYPKSPLDPGWGAVGSWFGCGWVLVGSQLAHKKSRIGKSKKV